jgi:SAM-dependent methyltransferase
VPRPPLSRAPTPPLEEAGATEPYADATLYDWEYRRRRRDVAFYRMLADERGGPVLDLGCGTGRILGPLLRDGHAVVGVDRSPAMLARAAARIARLGAPARRRALLVRGDLRQLPIGTDLGRAGHSAGRFPLAIAAFHSVQHLVDDGDLLRFFRDVRAALTPDGWLAFDVFAPDPRFLARPANRVFDRTVFRHPATGQRLAYGVSHRLDPARRALHMRLHYQPVDARGRAAGAERVVRLCHRQLPPSEVDALLRRAGLQIAARWGGFDGEPPPPDDAVAAGDNGGDAAAASMTEQHVYLARPLS